MDTIEEALWEQIVKEFLVTSPEAALSKAQQQALAAALQKWTARCIAARLQNLLAEQERGDLQQHIEKEDWQVHHKGKDFLGAVRWQEVDVWMANAEAGLVLAVDPKHFQSQDSLKRKTVTTTWWPWLPTCMNDSRYAPLAVSYPSHSGRQPPRTSSKSTAFAGAPSRANGRSTLMASLRASGWPYTTTVET